MEQVGFLLGYLFEHAADSIQFQKDVWESFIVVGEEMQEVVGRLEALEHNIDLKMVALIAPQGEA